MLKLRDLLVLYRRYVPKESRHYNVTDGSKWWPAHELGHLLTVKREWIGLPMFGLELDGDNPNRLDDHERLCRELAAMSVSHRLLIACGRTDLAKQEAEEIDSDTINYQHEPLAIRRVRKILVEHHCLRIPRTRDSIERKLVEAVHG